METDVLTHPVEGSTEPKIQESVSGEAVGAADIIVSAEKQARDRTDQILANASSSNDVVAAAEVEQATAEKESLAVAPRIKILFPGEGLSHQSAPVLKKTPKPTGVQKILQPVGDWFVRRAEGALTGMKKLIGPYYSSRRDFLDALQLKLRDKNWEEAKERGHGWIPKWVCGWIAPEGVANYTGKVLDWLGGPITEKAWTFRQRIGNRLRKHTQYARQSVLATGKRVLKKTGQFLFGEKQQAKNTQKRRKMIGSLKRGVERLDAWIHRPVKLGKKKKR